MLDLLEFLAVARVHVVKLQVEPEGTNNSSRILSVDK